jgi:formate dehydrogenase major subunit
MKIIVNGHPIEVSPGETILTAARRGGVDIPTLCHDVRVRPQGYCRLCLVEVDGAAELSPACATLVDDGLRVRSDSEELENFRRQELAWLARRISPSSFAAYPEKELHRLMTAYGVAPTGMEAEPTAIDMSHPYLRIDMSQCVTCFRCVRICDELQGQSVWHAVGRDDGIDIVPDKGSSLVESSCVGCGACADACPTAAITDRLSTPPVEKWVRTTCAYCGVGCELDVGVADGRAVSARPVLDAPVNKGHLCIKGRYAFGFNHAPDRLRQPLVRSSEGWRPATWDEGLGFAAEKLMRILAAHGPSAVGVLGSARATNEDNYVIQKLARAAMKTNNVDCCARVCHAPTAAAMKAMLGAGAATNSFDDIERANTLLVAGANPTENHPIIGARIRRRVKDGARLILIDPCATELSSLAAVHLRPRPGTDIALFNAMAEVIVNEGLADEAFASARTAEREEFRAHIAAWTPERAESICGAPAEAIKNAARLYARNSPAMALHGLGLTEHHQGTETVMALVNLALLTGNLGKAGAGVNPLRGQNNVQGAAHMGCDPGSLTGGASIEERRTSFERVWRMTLPRAKGLDLLEMIDAAAAGRLKALVVFGYDVFATLADMSRTEAALARLDLVVVIDLFVTETASRFAHVILPAASAFEKDGTFMNAERRIQRVRAAAPPPGEAWPDWRIAAELGRRLGASDAFSFDGPEAIWNEIRAVWPEANGITYPRLEKAGLQWPCKGSSDPGAAILHQDEFARGPFAPLARIAFEPTPERTSADYPLILSTGRALYQFNVGNMTMRTANRKLRPTDTLEMAPQDAERLILVNGDMVRVESRYGSAILPLEISDRVKPGFVFATFHDVSSAVNRLTTPHRDSIAHAPEYKVTAVSVRREV